MKFYGYVRVSTSIQNCENQHFEIATYARKNDIHIDKWIEEKISSRKPLDKRQLGNLINNLESGDTLITTEISRLGRNMLEIMSILKQCLEKNCRVWTLKEHYRLGSDIQSKVLAFAFSLAAEIERQLISQRVSETLKRLKNEGRHLGRPYGSSYRKLRKEHKKIIELLNKNVSKAEIARRCGCTWQTLHRYIQELE